MSASKILERLDRVKATGNSRWNARCPAHDDHGPSLSIRETDGGIVLLHCFAGCGAADVLGVIGLRFGDLFPESLGEFKPVRQPFSAWDALNALRAEAAVLAVAANDCAKGTLDALGVDRVALSAGRIATALEYINGRS